MDVGVRVALIGALVGALWLWQAQRRRLRPTTSICGHSQAHPTAEPPGAASATSAEQLQCHPARRSARPQPSDGAPTLREWRLSDLAALQLSPDYLFVYKQHDLHMDHPSMAVTLQTQLCSRFPELVDPKTFHGFRLVHQLDFATSGVLCAGLNKKAAARAGNVLFFSRVVFLPLKRHLCAYMSHSAPLVPTCHTQRHLCLYVTLSATCAYMSLSAPLVPTCHTPHFAQNSSQLLAASFPPPLAGKLFMERSVKKAYLAIVEGHVSWDETVASWAIGEDENDPKHFKVFYFSTHPPISPICRTPRFPYLTFYSCFF